MKTCMNCAYGCVSGNAETCERFKDIELYGDLSAKYRIYQTTDIQWLSDARLIGEASSYKEAIQVVEHYLAQYEIPDSHWRFLLGETATIIDYGSWSKFIAIMPPLSEEEMLTRED